MKLWSSQASAPPGRPFALQPTGPHASGTESGTNMAEQMNIFCWLSQTKGIVTGPRAASKHSKREADNIYDNTKRRRWFQAHCFALLYRTG